MLRGDVTHITHVVVALDSTTFSSAFLSCVVKKISTVFEVLLSSSLIPFLHPSFHLIPFNIVLSSLENYCYSLASMAIAKCQKYFRILQTIKLHTVLQ